MEALALSSGGTREQTKHLRVAGGTLLFSH